MEASGIRRILLVDDDDTLRETLTEQIKIHEDFTAVAVENGTKAVAAVKEDTFDAILLDIGLPDMDGRDVVKLMRKHGVKCPIILLTGADTDADEILGLESGANDYVTKPFRLNVLLARLRAQMRTHEQSDDAVFTIGPYNFKPAAKLLIDIDSNRKTRLTEKETAILKFLYRSGNKPVTRETLLNEVWGYNAAVNTHTLETHIYRLRQKIEPDTSNAQILVTENGGYRLAM